MDAWASDHPPCPGGAVDSKCTYFSDVHSNVKFIAEFFSTSGTCAHPFPGCLVWKDPVNVLLLRFAGMPCWQAGKSRHFPFSPSPCSVSLPLAQIPFFSLLLSLAVTFS